MQIFVKLLGGRTRSLCFNNAQVSVASLKEQIADYEGIPSYEQRLVCAQRELSDDAVLSGDDLLFLSLSLRVVGGKGGFGSLLRGTASKIGQKKTDNFDACRDLSGRRLRHANNEKKIADWIANEKEREMEKVALQHIKKLSHEHKFDDAKYTAEGDEIKETMSSALERGIDTAKKSGLLLSKKRAHEESESAPVKRRQAWTDDDDLFEGESEPETKEKKNKKSKEEHPLTPPSPKSSSSSSSSATTTTTTSTTTTTTTTSTNIISTITPENTTVEKSTVTTTSVTSTSPSPSPSSPSSSNTPAITSSSSSSPSPSPIDLTKYSTAKELEEAVGGDGLKVELQRLGLLCGGTPSDRAARLFLLKTTPLNKLDKKHFQKKKK